MKKIYKSIILLIGLFVTSNSFATIHSVAVQSSSFSPSSINVNVGDTVIWTWGGGTHSTTSTNVPSGATTWDSPITSGVPAFGYQVTVAGTYDYICAIHGFAGQIIATDASGISSPDVSLNFNISTVRQATYNISYTLRHSSEVKLSLYDITGKLAKVLSSSVQTAGEFNNIYSLEDLQKGIYIFELLAGNQRIIKRIILD